MWTRLVIPLVTLAVWVTQAVAVTDDLQCFKITNQNLKQLKAVVDIDAPDIGVAAGCKLGKAKLYCVPASTTVRPNTLLNGRTPIDGLPIEGPPAETTRICYGVQCKADTGTGPDQFPLDKLGEHELGKLKTSMLCTAASDQVVVPTGFQINSPSFVVPAGQEETYCFAFRTPNDVDTTVKAWTSELLNVERMIMAFTPMEQQPPGTLSTAGCGLLGFGSAVVNPAAWVYTAHAPNESFEFPADDGTGTPVGQFVPAHQAGYLWMHVINSGTEPVTAHVKIVGTEYPAGTTVTRADSFMTYNGNISIPPGSASDTETQTCSVPGPGIPKFTSVTTHSNKHSVQTTVKDGTTTLVQSSDFLAPAVLRVATAPFLTFASGQVTYQCEYANPSVSTILSGDSVEFDETCIALGFYFPSTRPRLCYNGTLLP